MSAEPRRIPTSSQTVGPFFHIGLSYLLDPTTPVKSANTITIRGRVLDRDRAPVSDAMLEFWTPAPPHHGAAAALPQPGFPSGFRRAATDLDGAFSVIMPRPMPLALEGHSLQAPHLLVLVFARGLLRQLVSRVYFDGDSANDSDPVLLAIPADRRRTLIAQRDEPDSFRWDVILQGTGETVFFAW